MTTNDSLGTSVSVDASLLGSRSEQVPPDSEFEEVIDLNNRNKQLATAEDLLNLNTVENLDNRDAGEDIIPKPIIAFEDNATRRQEVTGKGIVLRSGKEVRGPYSGQVNLSIGLPGLLDRRPVNRCCYFTKMCGYL